MSVLNQKLTPEQQKQYEDAWKYLCENQMAEGTTGKNQKGQLIKGVKPQDLVGWIINKPFKEIGQAIITTKDANVQSNYPAYIVTLFNKKVVSKKENIEINDEFLQEVMKKHKCAHLHDKKQYVTDNVKHCDYQKNSDPQLFKEMIMHSIEMAITYDQREHEYRQESEYEDDY